MSKKPKKQHPGAKRRKKLSKRSSKKPSSIVGNSGFLQKLGISMEDIHASEVLDAYQASSLERNGIGNVLISRKAADARIISGFFLVDIWCLGIKDAFIKVFSHKREWLEFIAGMHADMGIEESKPACIAKLILESMDYAQSIGFSPHPNYNKAKHILKGIDTTLCTRDFVFGKDGKPYYVAGPNESPLKQKQILNVLKHTCGEGNFHFVIADSF